VPSETKNVVAAACRTYPSVSQGDHLEATAEQSGAIIRPAQILLPSLEKPHPSLSDGQKLSLNDADPRPQNVSSPPTPDQSNENRTNLQVGARVKLRSGGPLMAVLSVIGTDVTCVWFDATGQAETGTFPAASLALNDAGPRPQNVSLRAQDQSDQSRTNLQVGARVRLRSGGPLMAVLSVIGTDVTCVWFDAAGRAETGIFPAASLM
jgi:uncharacterized protein YodC (DUF2158 family)